MTKEEAIKILDTIPTIGEQVDALEMAIKALEERSIATWEYVQYCSPKIGNFHCSNCRHIAINHKLSEYCPHCGARMEGIDA